MAVDFETFLSWAKDRFGDDEVKVRHTSHGEEILTHSFYAHRQGIEDNTFNLWMNPSGGKSKKSPEKGSFRCWKTDTMGTLVKLVADYDSIPYDEAEELLCGTSSLRSLERRVHDFFGHKEEEEVKYAPEPEPVKNLELPEGSFLIDKMGSTHFMRIRAKQYLATRKIPTDGLYVCISGDYKNRIVIPYYDADGNLIWYNARLMSDKKGSIKYMKCKSDGLNVTQEDVLFMTSWPEPGSKIYLMEGEIDAISMKLSGLVGCAVGGKYLSDVQVEMIRQYEPVLAFDADEGHYKQDTGLQALINIGSILLEKGFPNISYVRPPKVYKDWNKLFVERGPEVVKGYAEKFEKPFTASTPSILLSNRL